MTQQTNPPSRDHPARMRPFADGRPLGEQPAELPWRWWKRARR